MEDGKYSLFARHHIFSIFLTIIISVSVFCSLYRLVSIFPARIYNLCERIWPGFVQYSLSIGHSFAIRLCKLVEKYNDYSFQVFDDLQALFGLDDYEQHPLHHQDQLFNPSLLSSVPGKRSGRVLRYVCKFIFRVTSLIISFILANQTSRNAFVISLEINQTI